MKHVWYLQNICTRKIRLRRASVNLSSEFVYKKVEYPSKTLHLKRCKSRNTVLLQQKEISTFVMGDEDIEYVPTLEGQFASFAKLLDPSCPRETITLYCSDYWMRQSNIIDDREVTMVDTGVAWCKFSKSELNWNEWQEYLAHLCAVKGLNKLEIEEDLTNCGLPGATRVNVPQYRDFFITYKPKNALIICESLDSCGKPKKKPT